MSIITDKTEASTKRYQKDSATVLKPGKKDALSMYNPSDAEKKAISSMSY